MTARFLFFPTSISKCVGINSVSFKIYFLSVFWLKGILIKFTKFYDISGILGIFKKMREGGGKMGENIDWL